MSYRAGKQQKSMIYTTNYMEQSKILGIFDNLTQLKLNLMGTSSLFNDF